jgi:pSer/pThr/pTyr-binding forkhead associated (FHA) protein
LLGFRLMSTLEMTAVLAPNHAMVLQLATDKEIHAFDLSETLRVAVGRHHSNDIQLRSRRVSSYHAEILSEVEGLFVRDMGSTNGTYVNDEVVGRKRLTSGDCIRIGGFVLVVRLVPRSDPDEEASSSSELFPVGTVGSLLPFRGQSSSPDERRAIRERPDTTLPELLTELSRRNGSVLVTIRIHKEEGKIYLREGAVIHCEYGAVRRQKALYRLLALERGTYEIQELPTAAVPQTIHETTDNLVVEGMQQLEALDKLSGKLPAMMYELALNESCGAPVNTLTADEIEIYQQLIRHQTVARVLDEAEMTDFMVLLLTHALLQKGFFRTTKTPGALLEETVIKGPKSA